MTLAAVMAVAAVGFVVGVVVGVVAVGWCRRSPDPEVDEAAAWIGDALARASARMDREDALGAGVTRRSTGPPVSTADSGSSLPGRELSGLNHELRPDGRCCGAA